MLPEAGPAIRLDRPGDWIDSSSFIVAGYAKMHAVTEAPSRRPSVEIAGTGWDDYGSFFPFEAWIPPGRCQLR
jgi:hypothetical protein